MGMNHAYGASVDKTEMINLIAQVVDIVCPVTAIQNRYSMMARWHGMKIIPGTGRIKHRICGVFTTGKWIFVW